ncbi:hypothetical protein C4565_07730 [Candidatus Parcubacteria bacterium]|nr:MAG: hypothetical protein C4565_07730 [Candidatus Parcubacteria bacterium]
MKTIVSVQEISEFEIKPHGAVARWRALVEAEIAQRWKDRSGWVRVDWPTCKQKDAIPAFEHYGIAYVECPTCGSLYAPFRPSEDDLWAWYRQSAPARFWREQLLPASDLARREKIIQPRADWVHDGIAEYVPSARRLVDISSYGRGLIDLVAAENHGLLELVAAGMTADLEGISTSRVQVQPTRVADLPRHGPADVIVAIDVLDRVFDLGALVGAFEQLIAPRGIVFATAPVASGFEIQTLWERSPTVIPPDKMNLPTVKGLQQIFAAPTWEILELSTPGMFDVEMVRRAIEADPDVPWPRVVRALVERTDEAGHTALVELLQSRRLTSFARLVIRKAI